MDLPAAPRRRRVVVAAVTAIVTVGGYLALLGWDQHKTAGSDGYLHGPYEGWQVVTLVVLLAVLAAWAASRGAMWGAAVTATVVLTACWSIDAATDAGSDGLWGVGAMMVLVGTFCGFVLVGAVVNAIGRQRRDHFRTLV